MKLRSRLALGFVASVAAITLTDLTHEAPAVSIDRTQGTGVELAPPTATADDSAVRFANALSVASETLSPVALPDLENPQSLPVANQADAIPLVTATVQRDRAAMSAAVAALALAGGDARHDIIVAYDALPSAAELGALDARVQRDFPRLNMAQVNVPASSLNAFAIQDGVSLISLDEPLMSASSSSKHTAGKPSKGSHWNVPVASDIRVAVLDSGVSDLSGVNVTTRMDCTAGWTGSTRNYRDDFNARAVNGNNGTDLFSSHWIENGESDGVRGGALEIGSDFGKCLSGHCMEVEGYRHNVSYTRTLDLQGASEATLTYVASVYSGVGGAAVVEVSADGAHWHTLATYALGSSKSNHTETFDITAFASNNTTLRMRVTQAEDDDDKGVLTIDNLRVDASVPSESCTVATEKRDEIEGSLLDSFDHKSFANNNGGISFSSDWHEVGESNGPGTGDLEVDNDDDLCASGRCIQIETVTVGDALVRGANLAQAGKAKVNYVFSHTSGGAVAFEVSSDGGINWSTLATHIMDKDRKKKSVNFDITPWLSDDLRVRFRVAQANSWGKMGIDDFEIKASKAKVEGYDEFGHGTHVAGIVGGLESDVIAGDGGVAPNAGIVSIRVLDGEGRGVTSDVMAGLDWIIANAAQEKIRVVNLSLGKAVTESAATDPLVAAAEAVWDAGIVVVVSAGNYGRDGNFTITSPGNSPKLITVGALTDNSTNSFSDDYVSTFSSRGPTSLDNYLKPDLVAPGNKIIAHSSGKSKLSKDLKKQVKGKDRLELSGTSMAAAMTSGTAALMLSTDANLTPATVKARLMRSARKINEDPTAAGAGVLDIEAALAETGVMTTEALSPRMARSTQGNGILIENTAVLWGNDAWGAGYLWSDGSNWAQGYLWSDQDVMANGFLWGDEGLQSNGFLWSDEGLWANGFLWSDEGLWANGFLWSDEGNNSRALFSFGALEPELDDD
ncbi:MAG: S8 family peptidase [Pseudomonadota bacterium]